jgi:hypothetical protein
MTERNIFMSVTECNTGTIQKSPTGMKLKNMTTTSDNNGTLCSQNISRWMPLLLDIVMVWSSIVVLAPNGQIWTVPLLNTVSDISY